MSGVDMDAIYHYQPQPGTLPSRAIEYLRSQPYDTWVSTAALNEALGQPSDYRLTATLAKAKFAGYLKSRKAVGHAYFEWALGDGAPATDDAQSHEDDDDEDLHGMCGPVIPSEDALRAANPWRKPPRMSAKDAGSVQITIDGMQVFVRGLGDAVSVCLKAKGGRRRTEAFTRAEAVLMHGALSLLLGSRQAGGTA